LQIISLYKLIQFDQLTVSLIGWLLFNVKSVYIAPRPNKEPTAFCIFEYVYFARTDSIFEGNKEVKNYLGANQTNLKSSLFHFIISPGKLKVDFIGQ
jgi:hypothetical protein